MCGRFDLHAWPETVARALGVSAPFTGWDAHYNITPDRPIAAALPASLVDGRTGSGSPGKPVLDYAWWGFRPDWASDDAPGPINARAETVARSRYFRSAFRHQRCLIPANGWFEWEKTSTGKRPWYVTAPDDAVLFYAGIWAGSEHESGRCCAIITEPARGVAADIHPRMPLVLDRACWHAWLDTSLTERDAIRQAVHRLDPDNLRAWPVSTRVNRPSEDDESLIEPADG
ncbi:SOS response-associated peptidase [Spiribacter onubensis]|uniref:Abasic site processing protein n=1 Tax=Spiribacter onubensis TaxID=3122420 RepID=A0ABV3S9Z1_9GAMM